MTYDLEQDLRSLRPTDRHVDAELTPERRIEILTTAMGSDHRRRSVPTGRPHRVVRPLVLVAAAAGVLALVAGVSTTLPDHLAPVRPQPASAGTLDDLAARAARQGAVPPPGPGEYLAVTTVEEQTGGAPIRREAYAASDGWTWRKDTEHLSHQYLLYQADPGLDVSRLPGRPDALEDVLRAQPLGAASEEAGVFKMIGEVFRTGSVPPAVRRACLELLAEMAARPPRTRPAVKGGQTTPDVSADTGRIDQRPVTGATLTDLSSPGRSTTYWFDDETSDLVRTTQTFSGDETFSSEILERRLVDALPGDVVRHLGTDRVEKHAR